LALFRITQEALTNIRKHARATRAHITLSCSPDAVELIIADNGKGFEPGKESEAAVKRGSLGLLSMKERAHLAGAKLKIQSRPDQGTEVFVELPRITGS
jgi:signal transduction histidine kinase